MGHKHRPWIGYLLAAIGVLGLLAEVGLRFLSFFTAGGDYELNSGVLLVSVIIGFVGFYIINPKGAEGGTSIITRTAVAVIGVIRGGRRATDPPVVVTTEVEGAEPTVAKKPTFEDMP